MDYTETAADVLAALQEDGFAVTLRRQIADTYNPATGGYTGGTTTDYPAQALISSQSMPQSGNTGERYFDGTLTKTGDKILMLAASGLAVTPQPGDRLIVSGIIWQVVALITTEPGGVALFYRVMVRK
jgi:hypothetical protein